MNIQIVVEDPDGHVPGNLDIVCLLPNKAANLQATVLSKCIGVIAIKTPWDLANDVTKCVNQSRLQLIAISGGNQRYPFALLTNVTD
jgi:hypothetical protein